MFLLRSPKSSGHLGFFFLRRGGTIKCRVSTDRHRRSPLKQGELKVPCELIFVAESEAIDKEIVSTHTHTVAMLFTGLEVPWNEKNKEMME